jgi:hypothetical protein
MRLYDPDKKALSNDMETDFLARCRGPVSLRRGGKLDPKNAGDSRVSFFFFYSEILLIPRNKRMNEDRVTTSTKLFFSDW